MGKDIVGLNIQHGIFNSLITAGVLIDGSPQNNSSGGNIGPDGSDAIFDSQLLAGVQIKNLLINGNVTSDYVTNPKPNPTGYPTGSSRARSSWTAPPGQETAGELPAGDLHLSREHRQLPDHRLPDRLGPCRERRVPFGGNGTFPTSPYGAQPPSVANTPGDQGFNTYDAPNGIIEGGNAVLVNGNIGIPQIQDQNYSEASYFNETFFSRNGNFPKGDYTTDKFDRSDHR